jgi:hypothetical protein
MLKQNQLPMGLLLQHAGLISPEQLQDALKLQTQYTQMKLGEILALQQGIRAKTIDFFVDKWQETIEQGQLFPLGFYLQKAYLLNQQQIEIILQEQKSNQQKFGILAVQKGWIKQDTINFFLDNLSSKPPQLMSLDALEEYNQENLHLEKKYADHSLILNRILAWTGGIPYLTKTIGQVFAQSDLNISGGKEINAVDRFVEGMLIRKWQTSKSAASIRVIGYILLNNFRCDSSLLLKEYQDILISGTKKNQGNKEQKELLLLGLIVQENDRLKVSNIIYQQIFNQDFVVNQLEKMLPKATNTIDINSPNTSSNAEKSANPIVEYNLQTSVEKAPTVFTQTDSQIQPHTAAKQTAITRSPLTRISYLVVFAAIALLVPLWLIINNYLSSSKPERVMANPDSARKINELQQFCSELSFADSKSSLNLIFKLEADQQQLLNGFPASCDTALNHLRVLAAPQLGKENRILEAIGHLCKIPADSEMQIDAEVWLNRWYDSASWGKETKFYIEEIKKHDNKSCPAAHFAKYES